MRERRLLQGRIYSWQQEFGKERGVLDDEGLRTERRLLEERNTPMLKPFRTMRPMEGSRTKDGKRALSLRGVTRKALETASAWPPPCWGWPGRS